MERSTFEQNRQVTDLAYREPLIPIRCTIKIPIDYDYKQKIQTIDKKNVKYVKNVK